MFTILLYYCSMVALAISHLTQITVGADGNVINFAGIVEPFIMIISVQLKLINVSG